MSEILGILKTDKTLVLKSATVNQSENLTTVLKITLPQSFAANSVYIEFELENGLKYLSEELSPQEDNIIEYILPHELLKIGGEVVVQLSVVGDNGIVEKSLNSGENTIYVYKSINAAEYVLSTQKNTLVRLKQIIENIVNNDNEIDELKQNIASFLSQLNQDKQNGLFKGDKGEPSCFDKIVQPSKVVVLTEDNALFGTMQNPLILSENTDISFEGFVQQDGYMRSFILYVKRVADAELNFENSIIWAYNQPPLLPLSSVQKLHFETADGISFYGTAGDCFNV